MSSKQTTFDGDNISKNNRLAQSCIVLRIKVNSILKQTFHFIGSRIAVHKLVI